MTVHYVDEGMDTGEIIAQATFPNGGMENLDEMLAKYRRVGDMLIVNTFMRLGDGDGADCTVPVVDDILFSPMLDERVVEQVKLNKQKAKDYESK